MPVPRGVRSRDSGTDARAHEDEKRPADECASSAPFASQPTPDLKADQRERDAHHGDDDSGDHNVEVVRPEAKPMTRLSMLDAAPMTPGA